MALIIETVVQCDVCCKIFGAESNHLTGMQQRASARVKGWVYSGGKDYCPVCIPSKNKTEPKSKRSTRKVQKNYYLDALCKQVGVMFNNARFVSHANLGNKGTRVECWTIEWPNNKLNEQVVYRITRTPKHNGTWGKGKACYCLGETNSPEFDSLEEFIEHYHNK